MITLKDYMELIGYRITEGSDYLWKCFGPHAYRLDSWSGAWSNTTDGYTISIVFDNITQTVFEVEAWDYVNNRAYRLTNPDYVEAHNAEAKAQNIDPQEAWDDVKFVDLDVPADFLEKARAIVAGEDYDTRVQIEVDFADNELLKYMKLAHDLDITFNELVERALIEKLNELKGTENV
jgi:hypothetical protein